MRKLAPPRSNGSSARQVAAAMQQKGLTKVEMARRDAYEPSRTGPAT